MARNNKLHHLVSWPDLRHNHNRLQASVYRCLTVKLESSRLLSVTRLEISFDVCQYYVHMSAVHVAPSINSPDPNRKSEIGVEPTIRIFVSGLCGLNAIQSYARADV